MILNINFKLSVRCAKCGARLNAAEEIPAYNYDSIVVVDPHVCGVLTPHALDGATALCPHGRPYDELCEPCGRVPDPSPRQ
jgi:hypothetical protein